MAPHERTAQMLPANMPIQAKYLKLQMKFINMGKFIFTADSEKFLYMMNHRNDIWNIELRL